MTALPALASMASSPDVDLMSYQLSTEVVIRNGNKVSGILIKGVEGEKFDRVKKGLVEEALPQMLVDREGPNAVRYPGIFVGKELAYEMGLIPGDFVTVISPSQMDGPFNNIPRIKRFIVEGIYHFGVPEQEAHVAYTSLAHVESFLRRKGVISEIEIALKDSSRSSAFISKFRSDLTDLKSRDWNELNANLFASMRLERLAMFLILLFTVIISSLNIVSTLTLLVQEKIKEISILKTMGATPKSIRGIFVWKGILIGGSGVLFGTVGAFLICVLLKKYQFISLPDVYYDRTLPVTFDASYFLGVPIISFVIVCIASYYPARGAAKLTPLEGIREF
jgi:lipoprotein-releasing system permease protein